MDDATYTQTDTQKKVQHVAKINSVKGFSFELHRMPSTLRNWNATSNMQRGEHHIATPIE